MGSGSLLQTGAHSQHLPRSEIPERGQSASPQPSVPTGSFGGHRALPPLQPRLQIITAARGGGVGCPQGSDKIEKIGAPSRVTSPHALLSTPGVGRAGPQPGARAGGCFFIPFPFFFPTFIGLAAHSPHPSSLFPFLASHTSQRKRGGGRQPPLPPWHKSIFPPRPQPAPPAAAYSSSPGLPRAPTRLKIDGIHAQGARGGSGEGVSRWERALLDEPSFISAACG